MFNNSSQNNINSKIDDSVVNCNDRECGDGNAFEFRLVGEGNDHCVVSLVGTGFVLRIKKVAVSENAITTKTNCADGASLIANKSASNGVNLDNLNEILNSSLLTYEICDLESNFGVNNALQYLSSTDSNIHEVHQESCTSNTGSEILNSQFRQRKSFANCLPHTVNLKNVEDNFFQVSITESHHSYFTPSNKAFTQASLVKQCSQDLAFLNHIALSLFGPLLVQPGRLVCLTPQQLEIVERQIQHTRDEGRLHKTLNPYGVAVMCPDASMQFHKRFIRQWTEQELSCADAAPVTPSSIQQTKTAEKALDTNIKADKHFCNYNQSDTIHNEINATSHEVNNFSDRSVSSDGDHKCYYSIANCKSKVSDVLCENERNASQNGLSRVIDGMNNVSKSNMKDSFAKAFAEIPTEPIDIKETKRKEKIKLLQQMFQRHYKVNCVSASALMQHSTWKTLKARLDVMHDNELDQTLESLLNASKNEDYLNVLNNFSMYGHCVNENIESNILLTEHKSKETLQITLNNIQNKVPVRHPDDLRLLTGSAINNTAPSTIALPPELDTICVELKPKQGFLESVDGGSMLLCRFCLKQFIKFERGTVKKCSHYCPLELFSGDETRMAAAVRELFRAPQNNLRIFKNGTIVEDTQQYMYLADVLPKVLLYCPYGECQSSTNTSQSSELHLNCVPMVTKPTFQTSTLHDSSMSASCSGQLTDENSVKSDLTFMFNVSDKVTSCEYNYSLFCDDDTVSCNSDDSGNNSDCVSDSDTKYCYTVASLPSKLSSDSLFSSCSEGSELTGRSCLKVNSSCTSHTDSVAFGKLDNLRQIHEQSGAEIPVTICHSLIDGNCFCNCCPKYMSCCNTVAPNSCSDVGLNPHSILGKVLASQKSHLSVEEAHRAFQKLVQCVGEARARELLTILADGCGKCVLEDIEDAGCVSIKECLQEWKEDFSVHLCSDKLSSLFEDLPCFESGTYCRNKTLECSNALFKNNDVQNCSSLSKSKMLSLCNFANISIKNKPRNPSIMSCVELTSDPTINRRIEYIDKCHLQHLNQRNLQGSLLRNDTMDQRKESQIMDEQSSLCLDKFYTSKVFNQSAICDSACVRNDKDSSDTSNLCSMCDSSQHDVSTIPTKENTSHIYTNTADEDVEGTTAHAAHSRTDTVSVLVSDLQEFLRGLTFKDCSLMLLLSGPYESMSSIAVANSHVKKINSLPKLSSDKGSIPSSTAQTSNGNFFDPAPCLSSGSNILMFPCISGGETVGDNKTKQPEHASPFWIETSSGAYICQATVIDLVSKDPSKVIHHYKAVQKLKLLVKEESLHGQTVSKCHVIRR